MLNRLKVVEDLLDGLQLFGVFVWNLNGVFLFDGHDDFDAVKGVGTEIVDEV